MQSYTLNHNDNGLIAGCPPEFKVKRQKWEQMYNLDEIIIVEQKTGKTREIKINQQLKLHINFNTLPLYYSF